MSLQSRSLGVEANTVSDNIGPTLASLDLSFAFANPVHAAVSNTFFGKVSTMMVEAFEGRCLKVYGPGRE
jgi:coenzyme Q-binding protein COQ10